MLKQGDRGANVSKLQKTLKYLGYSCGKIDGIFGESTKNQVKRFQRHNGLPANGIVDVVTEKSLDYAINVEYKLRSEEHTSELQSRQYLVCRLLLEKKKISSFSHTHHYLSMLHSSLPLP